MVRQRIRHQFQHVQEVGRHVVVLFEKQEQARVVLGELKPVKHSAGNNRQVSNRTMNEPVSYLYRDKLATGCLAGVEQHMEKGLNGMLDKTGTKYIVGRSGK